MKFTRFSVSMLMVFAAGVAAAQVSRPLPASSNNNYSALAAKLVFPVVPTDICTASNTNCYSPGYAPPNQGGPSGMYCGRAAVYTDNMAITDRVACNGHLVAYTAYSQAWAPAQPGWCNDQMCYPDTPGYYYNASYFATDCPSGYRVTTTGSSGPYPYYACIKA